MPTSAETVKTAAIAHASNNPIGNPHSRKRSIMFVSPFLRLEANGAAVEELVDRSMKDPEVDVGAVTEVVR